MAENANADSASETDSTSVAEPELTGAQREALENAAWRRAQFERRLLFGGNDIGPFGDWRQFLFSAGRQIDWRRFR